MDPEADQTDLTVTNQPEDPMVTQNDLTVVDLDAGGGPPPGPSGRRRPVIVACGD